MAKSEWVRVRSESELRPGMTVEARKCYWCSRNHRRLILRILGMSESFDRNGDAGMERGYEVAPPSTCSTGGTRDVIGYASPIRDGRLFRLRDLDEADETTEVAKELEVTRG